MLDALTNMATNLGVSIDALFCLPIFVGCIIFFASSFAKGLVVTFVMAAGVFVWFYHSPTLNEVYPLVLLLLNVAGMSYVLLQSTNTSVVG